LRSLASGIAVTNAAGCWLLIGSIIQRAGIIPLSIAGMFKEVSTISISALVFGDQLTPVNIGGVAIAVIGECSPSSFFAPRLSLLAARVSFLDCIVRTVTRQRLPVLHAVTATGSIADHQVSACTPTISTKSPYPLHYPPIRTERAQANSNIPHLDNILHPTLIPHYRAPRPLPLPPSQMLKRIMTMMTMMTWYLSLLV
jgi:hypothetical protein